MNRDSGYIRPPVYRQLGKLFYGGFFLFLFLLPLFRGVVYPVEKGIFFLFILLLWLIWQFRKPFTPEELTGKRRPFYKDSFFWGSFFLTALIWLQTLSVSAKPVNSLPPLLEITSVFLVFNLSREAFSHRHRKKQLFRFLSVLSCFHVLLNFCFCLNLMNTNWWETPEFLSGTFVNHNHFAGFLSLLLFFVFGRTLAKRSEPCSHLLLLLFALWTLLLLSMSRGSWLACFATFLIGGLMLFRNKSLRKLGLRITGGILTVIIIFLIFIQIEFNPHATERFYSFFNAEKQAEFSDFRLRLWQSTISAIKEKPWFGYGCGAFEWEMRPFRQEHFPYKFDYAHNDYLQFVMECGLVISIAAFIFLLSCIFSFFRKFRSPTLHYFRFEDFGLFLGLLCLLLHGLVDFNLHIFSNFIFFGLYAGLITKAR